MLLSRVDPRVRWLAPGRVKRQHGVSRLPGHSSRCRMSILWAALTRTCCAMTDLPQGEQEREKGNRVGGKSKSEYPGRKQVRCSKICEGVKITQSTSPSATYRRWHLGASHRQEGGGETFSCGAIFFSGSFYARDFTEKGNVDLVPFCKLEVPNMYYTGGAARVEARLSLPWILDHSRAYPSHC